jgi:hypothetical protein
MCREAGQLEAFHPLPPWPVVTPRAGKDRPGCGWSDGGDEDGVVVGGAVEVSWMMRQRGHRRGWPGSQRERLLTTVAWRLVRTRYEKERREGWWG